MKRQPLFDTEAALCAAFIDRTADGTPLPKDAQVRMCGNSVCPPIAAAVVRAQFAEQAAEAVA